MTDQRKDETTEDVALDTIISLLKAAHQVGESVYRDKIRELLYSQPPNTPLVPDDVAEAIKRAQDDMDYCRVELRNDKSKKIGYADLTYTDLETFIRAASKPSAEVQAENERLHALLNESIVMCAERKAEVRALREALLAAKHFINNGVTLGYIKMPDTPEDPAWFVMPKIEEALKPHTERK